MRTLKTLGEFGLIRRIAKQFKYSNRVVLGIGDDAALVKNLSRKSLLTTDMLVEGVDFNFKTTKPEAVGRKALAINLSDIAAMGGTAQFALIGLGIPRTTKLVQIEKFLSGISRMAAQFKVDVVGGDLSKAPCWMVSVTLVGAPGKRIVCRSGARVGDVIYVTGTLGGSIQGKHFSFMPRVKEGQWLAKFGATAMIDTSDGLVQDLGHILKLSKKGAAIELEHIPISNAVVARRPRQSRDRVIPAIFKRGSLDSRLMHSGMTSRSRNDNALRHALTDGEDFELLFTVAKSKAGTLEKNWARRFKTRLTRVGTIQKRANQICYLQNGAKINFKLAKKGYEHF